MQLDMCGMDGKVNRMVRMIVHTPQLHDQVKAERGLYNTYNNESEKYMYTNTAYESKECRGWEDGLDVPGTRHR